MMEQQMMNSQGMNNIPDLGLNTNNMSLQDKIIVQAKQPLLVGVIVAVLSLPFLNTIPEM